MNSRINFAIIGYGYMGAIYKKACLELYNTEEIESYYKYDLPLMLKGFRLKAIVDTSFQDSWYDDDEGIWYFNNLDTMLESDSLDINTAVIAAPITTHYEIAKKLIQKKISLLIEKPVCETAREVKSLIGLSKKYRVKIMPGHVERYNPVTLEAVEAVKYKVYGRVESYRFLRKSSKPARVKDSLITDKLIHDLDLVLRILGKFKISDIKVKKVDGEIMECTLFTFHRNGVWGIVVSSWLSDEKIRTVAINFKKGSFKGDLIHKVVAIDRYGELSKHISGYRNNQIKDQLVDFIAYSKKYRKPLVNIHDALESAYLIDEINRKLKGEI